jgi:hypothetical protein
MLMRWTALPRGGRWLIGGTILALAAVIAWVLFVPAADWLARHDVGSATGSLLQAARDAARGRLLTLGAGLFAAGALVYTARNYTLSREGQVTDRYTKAIEQLGSKGLDVRIGGIYALERIARDSARDHPVVMEVLSAFVRVHSHEQSPTRPDVQAALRVIGRRNPRHDSEPIDLESADLAGANLNGANLAGAWLRHANLTGAGLVDANLHGAILWHANLTDANLLQADLGGATLFDANLTRADLGGANLSGALLRGADLTDTHWSGNAPIPEGWERYGDTRALRRAGAESSGPETS